MTNWHKILEVAKFAPSPHNVQPWKIKIIDDTRAQVFIDIKRTLPQEDITGSFIISAMGMFVESLRIIAANFGIHLKSKIITTHINFKEDLNLFAEIVLSSEAPAISSYSNELFLKRRTSRLPSKNIVIDPKCLDRLTEMAKVFGHRFCYIDDPITIEAILNKNIEALFHDLNDPMYHDEIELWFRYTDAQAKRTRDGLDVRCMNMSTLDYYIAGKFPKLLQIPVARLLIKNIYTFRLGFAKYLGFLDGPFWQKDAALETGRFLIQFWLELTKADLYIHPFGNMVTNKAANAWMHEKMKLKQIWLVFRFGHSEPAPQSYRLRTEDLILA